MAESRARIKALSKSNHETWKMLLEAVLIINDRFKYVSEVAPTLEPKEACGSWKIEDSKTRPMRSAKRAEADKELSNGERYVGKAREHLLSKSPCEKG
ncbi:hypothetical protein AVEN_2739-1 [Araneus ventricosus]|uniref:Uncharacterized protein n=1 Tax=Araneus ventricosus TaxID=182803 RepID=A0A4Y2PVK9_ARAVE|nr:hypothetical protein AVEN_2739-1 [Araneus ventricosus]